MPNLDRLAAQRAQAIITRTVPETEDGSLISKAAKEADNTVTKTLGVLQENGLYACALFLTSRTDREIDRAQIILDELLNLLVELDFGWTKPNSRSSLEVLRFMSDTVTENLERLLLSKEVCEQSLIYARYGAKARSNEG